jgi:ABC-type transport system involved in cytochrome bd biosynthesis fused ATPase/permease subunit
MLENGSIIEQGNHEQLLRINGKYAQMWAAQVGNYLDKKYFTLATPDRPACYT